MVWGKLFGRQTEKDIQAYVDTMVILAMADGELEENEVQDLWGSIALTPRLKGISDRQIIAVCNEAYKLLMREGVDARLRAIANALPEKSQRIDAMTMAISMSASDGTIEPEEMAILRKMQDAFGLSDDDINSIIANI
jgi:tellurite resistance protein